MLPLVEYASKSRRVVYPSDGWRTLAGLNFQSAVEGLHAKY